MKSSYALVAILGFSFAATPAFSQFLEAPTPPPPSLKEVALPTIIETISELPLVDEATPDGANGFIKDEAAAVLLGKALFWDSQAGGDGNTACATCHFDQGRDSRTLNTVHPGPDGVFTAVAGPGMEITANAFPFLGDGDDDRVGSQGVVRVIFNSVVPGNAVDNCTVTGDDVFLMNRQVTGRNTPVTFLAANNIGNFWDGRAKNVFNGVTGGGEADAAACIWVPDNGGLECVQVRIEPASLASQAVGPPNNEVEMSCLGRTFPELARKMLSLQPLGNQMVDSDDSVLSDLRDGGGMGLDRSYEEMIQDAFPAQYWGSTTTVNLPANNGGSDDFSQIEANFSLFWGLAIQAYVETLVPKDHAFADRDLSRAAKRGLEVFEGDGRCDTCHGDIGRNDDFTEASRNEGGGDAFSNSAVRPIEEDSGVQPDAIGEFKTPTMLNVQLSGPYFHNGGALTLRQVVEFYNAGGGEGANKTELLKPLGLNANEKADLVEFLKSLTGDAPAVTIPELPEYQLREVGKN